MSHDETQIDRTARFAMIAAFCGAALIALGWVTDLHGEEWQRYLDDQAGYGYYRGNLTWKEQFFYYLRHWILRSDYYVWAGALQIFGATLAAVSLLFWLLRKREA